MIWTRVGALDDFLGGRVPGGMILDVYGPAGAGKTQILLQISAVAAAGGRHVAYVDAAGGFRPERILQMAGRGGADILDNISVLRAASVSDQLGAPRRLAPDVSVLLVDNVTDLFLYEYAGDRRVSYRSHLFMKHMRDLSLLARAKNIPVVVSNMIRHANGQETESMGRAIGLYTHAKMRLSGSPEYMARCSSLDRTVQFGYSVEGWGVRSRGGYPSQGTTSS